ncbi:hypothetical protein MASR2M39_04220 [Ignavibacteriales bacterium]
MWEKFDEDGFSKKWIGEVKEREKQAVEFAQDQSSRGILIDQSTHLIDYIFDLVECRGFVGVWTIHN